MNTKRLLLAIATVFAGAWLTDFLIHGVLLRGDYLASQNLWRSDVEMQAHCGWIFAGEILAAAMFVLIYAKGFAAQNCLRCACIYGACMGVFNQAASLISYAVEPLPGLLVAKWFCCGVAQAVLMGAVVFFVYKPNPAIEPER